MKKTVGRRRENAACPFSFVCVWDLLPNPNEVAMSSPRLLTSRKLTCIAIVVLPLLCTSCGSSSGNTMSNAQAQAISQEFVTALQSAMTGQFYGGGPGAAHASLSEIIRDARPAAESGCTQNPPITNGETCNFPISYSGTCPAGGTISVSGDFNLTLNSSGTGSDSSTLTITPNNCVVSDLTINGEPSVTLATTIGYTNGVFDFPVTMNESGGISYGPHPAGSCTVNVTLKLQENSCSISGTVCGHSVTGDCPAVSF
jgi:hypothetical protein